MIEILDLLPTDKPKAICVGLLRGGALALFDSGPDSGFPELAKSIRALGLSPDAVRHVFITHVHLDHAGGAWRWAQEFGATIYVHPEGERHLADPTRLVASATRVFGADMDRLWGRIAPIPADRLRVVRDGDRIDLGFDEVRVVETLGHARHHHAYWVVGDRALYAGDVAGVCIDGGPCVPPCPPPDIHVETWTDSLARIRSLRPDRVVATHGGFLDRPAERLDELECRLRDTAAIMLAQWQGGASEEDIVRAFERRGLDELRAAGVSDATARSYHFANPWDKSALGLLRYLQKRHPAASPAPL